MKSHEKISGHRDLTQAEIDAINEVKMVEAKMGEWLSLMDDLPDSDAQRWLSLARTHLETGFMFAMKAVARPTNGLGRNLGRPA